MVTDERLQKLPNWARLHIAALESRIKILERDNEYTKQLFGKIADNDTTVSWREPGSYDGRYNHLPDFAKIELKIASGRVIQISRDYPNATVVNVSAQDGYLVIRPGASNIVRIHAEE